MFFSKLLYRLGSHFTGSFERFDCQVERANWTEFFQSPNKSCESDSQRKRTSAILFWCKKIALKKPVGGLRPITVDNTFRRLSAKCAGYHVFESRQARYGSRQVGAGTRRDTELASHASCCLIESPQPKENVILKIDFENVFNATNQQFMLEKVFGIHPEVYMYSHAAYSLSNFLFYRDSVMKPCEGTQQGDPESPALFSDSTQNLIDS